MYKGKMTYFYNGEILADEENYEYLVHSKEERLKWEVIVVLPGVEVIPEYTFETCYNVETVIMADSVRRIEEWVFSDCRSLEYIRLSRNLEYIGRYAFLGCSCLTSIFIPPSCREIGWQVFCECTKLIILSVPQHTQLGRNVIAATALIETSPFETFADGFYENDENEDEVNQWIKNINQGEGSTLHLVCSAFNPPLENDIVATMRQQGLQALSEPNSIGVTPLEYLEANPNAQIDQSAIVKRFVLEMMGEVV